MHLGLDAISRQTNVRASAPPLFAPQHQTAPATFTCERDTNSEGYYSYSGEGLSKGPPRLRDPRDRIIFPHPNPCSCPDCKEVEMKLRKRVRTRY